MTVSEPVTLRFKRLRSSAREPIRATSGSTGYDLHACIEGRGFLDIGPDPVRVPTGIAIETPPGYDVQIRPRSGLALRGVLGTFGTVDSDYRGELFVTLYTVGIRGVHRVLDGERIAQLIVARSVEISWEESETLTETERGAGGHGSTGS